MAKRPDDYDAKIMNELLNQPEIKPFVQHMTPEERDWYRTLLVTEGIYDRYLRERKAKGK